MMIALVYCPMFSSISLRLGWNEPSSGVTATGTTAVVTLLRQLGWSLPVAVTASSLALDLVDKAVAFAVVGALVTPPPSDNILEGITRRTVMTLLRVRDHLLGEPLRARKGRLRHLVVHELDANATKLMREWRVATPSAALENLAASLGVSAASVTAVGAAVDAVLQVIAGLEAAQAVGILHRDIKPGNILLDEQQQPRVRRTALPGPSRGRSC